MTIYEFAEGLNGREYKNEITKFEIQRAKELGFIVVFGYSDDNAEFRGAYDDEVECFDGGRVYEDGENYIDAVWCKGDFCWSYDTNIPHATFDIYEDGEKFCKGIVFEKNKSKALTNYDRIKNMSVEEMAAFLENTNSQCAIKLNGEYRIREKDYIKEWLESEVTEE